MRRRSVVEATEKLEAYAEDTAEEGHMQVIVDCRLDEDAQLAESLRVGFSS